MKTSTLKVLAILALPLTFMAVAMPAQAATEATRYITVSAEGTVKVTPDAVRLNATVSALANTRRNLLPQKILPAKAFRSIPNITTPKIRAMFWWATAHHRLSR